jgi:hypothetical protein
MVDFGELKDKAQDLVAQHSDTVKDGITKAGDFIGEKVGHDKLNPIEDKLHDLVDKAAGKDDDVPPPVDLNQTPVAPPPPPVVPRVVPPTPAPVVPPTAPPAV